MLADIHHWGRKGFKLVALAEAKPFLTPGQGGDQGKKDPERGDRKKQTGACLFFSPCSFRSTDCPYRETQISLFFLRGELDTKQPLDRSGSPSLPALLAARGPGMESRCRSETAPELRDS